MEAVFLKLVNMSFTASWLVLAVIAVRFLFRKTPKWVLCLLWGLVAFRLICPVSMESALSLIPSAEPLPQDIIYTAHPEIHSGIPVVDDTVNPILESSMTPSELVSINPTQVWSFVFTQIWILGLVIMLIYALISYLLLKRKVATAIPLRKNIKRCEFIGSPFVLGFFFPVIYLPTTLEKKDWEYVISHEEAHIQRRDHWWKPIGFLLLSIYWFNPVLWLAYILLCRDIEAACDEKVIKNMDKDALRAYSTALLKSSIHQRSITACPLAFGEVGIKERIRHVMNYKKPSFWVILISLVLILVLSVTLLTNPEAKYDPDKVYPQSVLQEPDRIYIDVSGTDRVFEKDSLVYKALLEAFQRNWWKYTEEDLETAADSLLISPIAPEVLKTKTWRTYVDISDTIICFRYTENPIVWENAKGEEICIQTIGFVLPEKTYSEDNTRGFFLISETEQIGINEGLYTYYYPPEIANDFWDFVITADLNEVRTYPGETLTLNEVISLSQKGNDLTLNDFMRYGYEEKGDSQLAVRTYPINDQWHLLIQHGGGLEKPIVVWLSHRTTGKHVDITQGDTDGAITDFIRMQDPEAARRVVCVDIWTRKQTCLSSKTQTEEILSLLRELENHVKPVSAQEFADAQKDPFHINFFVINYELGSKNVVFSENFDIVWETGAETGYRIGNPEPIRSLVESVTNGVRENVTSGEPFATMDAPWDWCTNIHPSAVKTAELHVCLSTYSSGNVSGSTSTNGVISYDTLQQLTEILNQIPRSAFTPGKVLSKETYHGFFIDQSAENTAISILDGINNLGVVLNYRNGKVTLLLTNEMEKVARDSFTYLEPTQLWTVEDQRLTAFLQSISENPPVINYSVGAEYQWQRPMDYRVGNFTLNLRLIEGWEGEYVTASDNSGIRCRPAGITDGWIYFSYWPQDYSPEEEDRYYSEGGRGEYQTITSYPSSVKSDLGVDLRHAVWSYRKIDLNYGDYVIINDGADDWFHKYEDQIEDTITLADFSEK